MAAPKLRFHDEQGREYPEWETKKIGDYFKVKDIKTIDSKETPLMAFVANKGIAPKGKRYDRSALVKTVNKQYKRTDYGDFIYSSNNLDVGSIGLNLYGTAAISPVYEIFESKMKMNLQCINTLIQRPKNLYNVLRFRQGVIYGQLRIHPDDFLKVTCSFPSLPEQEKISNFLTSYDHMIDVQSKRVEAMKNRKKGLLQKIFSQEIRFKDEQGREYPEWLRATFGNLFLALRKNALSRDTLNYEHGNIKNIHYGDILVGFGATVQSTSPLVPYINADKIPKSYDILQCGDIIIADTAEDETAGKGIEIINDSIPTISGLHTLPYRPQTKFAPGYLGYFLNSPYYHKQLIPLLHGIKVLSVTKAELEKTIISYPTLPEQQKIASFFTAVDKQIEVEEKRLETMKTIKKGLLQQMFI